MCSSCSQGLFAFHKAGYKPNARSYNVVMEDACHFLKYGTVLHGEWFIDGQRVPLAHGKQHPQPLPAGSGLSERPKMPPDFPKLARMEARHDGCPNQFNYSCMASSNLSAVQISCSKGWFRGDLCCSQMHPMQLKNA